jgi:hypothetical protein
MKRLGFVGKPFIKLGEIEVPIDEEVTKRFSRLKIQALKVIPFERVGQRSWNAVTFLPYDHKLRNRFFLYTNNKLHFLHFVSEDEFLRILDYF